VFIYLATGNCNTRKPSVSNMCITKQEFQLSEFWKLFSFWGLRPPEPPPGFHPRPRWGTLSQTPGTASSIFTSWLRPCSRNFAVCWYPWTALYELIANLLKCLSFHPQLQLCQSLCRRLTAWRDVTNPEQKFHQRWLLYTYAVICVTHSCPSATLGLCEFLGHIVFNCFLLVFCSV